MSPAELQATGVPLYAGFWRRAAAVTIDGLILITTAIVISVLFARSRALVVLIGIVIGCTYHAGFHSSAMQATPGKMAFGIKVSDLAGERIGIPRAIGRYFAVYLSTLILWIGYLMAAFTQKRQALHDVIAGTVVVNALASPNEIVAGGRVMPVTTSVWVAIALFLIVPFFGGILAGIAIPAFQDYTVRVKVAEALTATAPLKGEIQQAYAQKQPFRTGSIQVASQSVKSVEVNSTGMMVITLVRKVAGGGSIIYTPSIDSSGTMVWKCSSEDVPAKYLPAFCRK